MTEKLYDLNGCARAFSARVLSCEEREGLWAVELDRTAFFPMGGGQPGDRGILDRARVTDTREEDGVILHFCDKPLNVGSTVRGMLDWELRFARMQIHSGEHVVSGIAHGKWGCENVGFHMTEDAAVLDFDRELDEEQLRELEERANRVVWADLPIRVFYPTEAELAALSFRQKKELTGPVRLVEIEGIDRCACCAPHVKSTGEIGLIHLTEPTRHRGGVRLTLRAGLAAWQEMKALSDDADALSHLLSAPRTALPGALTALLGRMEEQKAALAAAERRYTALLLRTAGEREGDLCFFLPAELSAAAARELAEQGKERCTGLCAVFSANPAGGWRYVIASRSRDLRAESKALNAALQGRGGGSAGMIQGSAAATRAEIEALFPGGAIE